MPVQVTYEPTCDAYFRAEYENVFYDWINTAGNATLGAIHFDEAHVLNGLHPTTSQHDPNTDPHVTIRLSNATLRSQRAWYILHWRPNGGSVILPNPDNSADNDRRRQKREEKKKRQQERKKDEKVKKDKGGRDGGAGSKSSSSVRG